MKKDEQLFDRRNEYKKKIEFWMSSRKRIKKWQIRIVKIWVNIGSEISKWNNFVRPVLVVSPYLRGDLIGVIPMTTKYNENFGEIYYKFTEWIKYGLLQESRLLLNQYKVISKKRLQRKCNEITVNGSFIKKVPSIIVDKIIEKMTNFHFSIKKNEPSEHVQGGGKF